MTSTKPVGGTITFFEQREQSQFGFPMPVVNGSVQIPFAASLGPDQILAKYSGDAANQASQSAPVPYLGVGTGGAGSMLRMAAMRQLSDVRVRTIVVHILRVSPPARPVSS